MNLENLCDDWQADPDVAEARGLRMAAPSDDVYFSARPDPSPGSSAFFSCKQSENELRRRD